MQFMKFIHPSDWLRDSREPLMDNFRTLASNSSGNSFPIGSEIQKWQWCVRDDQKKLYILTEDNPERVENWRLVIDLTKHVAYTEDVSANYSLIGHPHQQSDIVNFEHNHVKEDITNFTHSHIADELPRAGKDTYGVLKVGSGLQISDDNILSSDAIRINPVNPKNGDLKIEFVSGQSEPYISIYVDGVSWKQIFPPQWQNTI